jgi:tRNA (cytidine/uridine-2'-O-)-methyltransferase
VRLHQHVDFQAFQAAVLEDTGARLLCFSAHAVRPYTAARFQPTDVLLFGSESRGLPRSILDLHPEQTLTIPMRTKNVRSLNLATAVGIVLYEGLRQVEKW